MLTQTEPAPQRIIIVLQLTVASLIEETTNQTESQQNQIKYWFWVRRKILSEQSREPTNLAHIRRRVSESNTSRNDGWRVLSPLHQPWRCLG